MSSELAKEVDLLRAELSRLDAELVEVNRHFRMLFDRNPNGVAINDATGAVMLNQFGAELIGGPAIDATGRAEDAYGIFLPDRVTPHPVEALPMRRALRGETIRNHALWLTSEKRPNGIYLDVSARPLANGGAIAIFRDANREQEALAQLEQRKEQLAARETENLALLERLRHTLEALSTPVIEVAQDVLALPVIGVVDSERSGRMTEAVLSSLSRRTARYVIIDVTGVAVMDTSTADRLVKLADAVRLLGAECIICGIRPAVAQTLVAVGVDLTSVVTKRDLQRALEFCVGNRRS